MITSRTQLTCCSQASWQYSILSPFVVGLRVAGHVQVWDSTLMRAFLTLHVCLCENTTGWPTQFSIAFSKQNEIARLECWHEWSDCSSSNIRPNYGTFFYKITHIIQILYTRILMIDIMMWTKNMDSISLETRFTIMKK